jgi:antitoxin (DNA-binding transcriptional repressor) of toxin-antitoxin stability system
MATGGSASVGVRELRQNLSVHLDRVKRGEALNVTEHGHIVAVLRPAPCAASPLDLLIAKGLATPARRAIQQLPRPRPPRRAGRQRNPRGHASQND